MQESTCNWNEAATACYHSFVLYFGAYELQHMTKVQVWVTNLGPELVKMENYIPESSNYYKLGMALKCFPIECKTEESPCHASALWRHLSVEMCA